MVNTTNNDNVLKQKKKTRGRQRIEIKKLENKSSLQVAFSKRRCGLFNKAMELSVLCGAEVGVLVFSPNGKMYVIGQPDFDTLLNWFLNGETLPLEVSASIPCVQEHNKQYEDSLKELEKEKKKGKVIEEEKKMRKGFWWETERIDQMGLEELEQYEKGLQKLKSTVTSRINEMMMNQYMFPPAATSSTALMVAPGNDDLLGNNSNVGCVMNGGGAAAGAGAGYGFDLQYTHFRI